MPKAPRKPGWSLSLPPWVRRWGAALLDEAGRRLWDFEASLEDVHLGGALPLEGDEPVERARLLCQRASSILLFTGSGLSAASGIKTFRGGVPGASLYGDPVVRRMTDVQTFGSLTEAQAQLLWHQQWKQVIQASVPNRGHIALAKLARGRRVSAVTQNVDTLLEQAFWQQGQPLDVVHLHGVLEQVKCHECAREFYAPAFDFTHAPPCARCGGRLRPAVVWFGETPLPQEMKRARRMVQHVQVCLVIGTSGQVAPASYLPQMAKAHGVRLIEVNPQETACSEVCDVVLRARAEEVLPLVVQGL